MLLAALLAGCAAAPPAAEVPPPATAPDSSAPAAPPTDAAAKTTATASARGDEVVCRRDTMTGSRLRQRSICKTRNEWDEQARAARESMRSIDNRSAPQRGDSVPGGS